MLVHERHARRGAVRDLEAREPVGGKLVAVRPAAAHVGLGRRRERAVDAAWAAAHTTSAPSSASRSSAIRSSSGTALLLRLQRRELLRHAPRLRDHREDAAEAAELHHERELHAAHEPLRQRERRWRRHRTTAAAARAARRRGRLDGLGEAWRQLAARAEEPDYVRVMTQLALVIYL